MVSLPSLGRAHVLYSHDVFLSTFQAVGHVAVMSMYILMEGNQLRGSRREINPVLLVIYGSLAMYRSGRRSREKPMKAAICMEFLGRSRAAAPAAAAAAAAIVGAMET